MKRLLLLLSTITALTSAASAQTPAAACDRACLSGFITQYLDAMVAHNPAQLPTTPTMKFTENTVTLKLGEGLWKSISKTRTYRLDMIDVAQGVAAAHIVVEESSGAPTMLALRMKIVDRKISEIETIVAQARTQGPLDALKAPKPAMTLVPDKSQAMSRADLIRIAEFYPAGLKVGGTFEAVNAPFGPNAYRFENGTLTAGPGARAGSENIKTQRIIAHPDVTYRLAAVDEQLGIVLFRLDFGDTNSYGPGNALTMMEAFKVYGGQIHAVEAFMRVEKANTPSGWDDRYEVKKPK